MFINLSTEDGNGQSSKNNPEPPPKKVVIQPKTVPEKRSDNGNTNRSTR